MPRWRPLRPKPARKSMTVATLLLAVAVLAGVMAVGRWVASVHPENIRRMKRAESHRRNSTMWAEVADAIEGRPELVYALTKQHYYVWSSPRPTGTLADSARFDATRGSHEYSYGDHHWLGPPVGDRTDAEFRKDLIAVCRERAAYHQKMQQKWASYARFFWLDVEPDPPAPAVIYEPTGDSF
jgi:hypothetical protein